MKKNNICGLIIIVFVISGFSGISAQTKKIVSVDSDRQKIGSVSIQRILESLNNSTKDFDYITNSNSSIITIQPSVRKTGMKTIEGMETKKVGKAVVSFKIKNEASDLDSLVKSEYSISGKNDTETDNEILDNLNKDQQLLKRINEIVSYYYNIGMSDCTKNLVKVEALETDQKYREALLMLLKIENSFTSCKPSFQVKKAKLTKDYEKNVCDKLLYDAKIYINSGVEYQMNKAVGLLLQIPPSAECRNEAIKLAEELSTKMNLTKANSEKLVQYQKIIIQNNNDSWYNMLYGGN
ncbi:MAG: hypothetical protein KAX53_04775 [Saprospiraceae bacterium]|nr:hypothetical protein [Saprospiraceae bacterium]HRG40064.1 hypothetical protein [Saprospiraceae bacterium]